MEGCNIMEGLHYMSDSYEPEALSARHLLFVYPVVGTTAEPGARHLMSKFRTGPQLLKRLEYQINSRCVLPTEERARLGKEASNRRVALTTCCAKTLRMMMAGETQVMSA